MSAPNPFISNGTCYFSRGKEVDDWYPCGNSALGDKTCCQSGDMCLSSRACYNSRFGITYLAGCSDPEYQHPSCPSKGSFSDQPWTGLVYCNGTSEEWVACAQSAQPTTLTSADACWCPETSRTVAFTDSSRLENVVQLPTALGGSVIWQPGHVPMPTQPNTIPTFIMDPTTINTISNLLPQPTETETASGDGDIGMATGAKIGLGVGVGSGCAVLIAALIYLFFSRRRWRRTGHSELDNASGDEKGYRGIFPAMPEPDQNPSRQLSTRTELDGTPLPVKQILSEDRSKLHYKPATKFTRPPSPIAELPG